MPALLLGLFPNFISWIISFRQIMEFMFGTDKIVDMENTEVLGNYGGKSGLGANTGEAAGLEMPPSSVWECLGTWFPFSTWEVSPAHLQCLLKVSGAPKGTLRISSLGNVLVLMFG